MDKQHAAAHFAGRLTVAFALGCPIDHTWIYDERGSWTGGPGLIGMERIAAELAVAGWVATRLPANDDGKLTPRTMTEEYQLGQHDDIPMNVRERFAVNSNCTLSAIDSATKCIRANRPFFNWAVERLLAQEQIKRESASAAFVMFKKQDR